MTCIPNEFDVDNYGLSGFTKQVIRRAKARPEEKPPHRCQECGDPIKRGDRYELIDGVCEGRWFRERRCLICVEIVGLFCEPIPAGRLQEECLDSQDSVSPCQLDKLTVPARERLIEWAHLDEED